MNWLKMIGIGGFLLGLVGTGLSDYSNNEQQKEYINHQIDKKFAEKESEKKKSEE